MVKESKANAVHQADLLFLPHDKVSRSTYRYTLTAVNVASCYKEAETLTSKTAQEVADAFIRIYKCGPLTWSHLLQVDSGHEFMGATTQILKKNNVQVRRATAENHRQPEIVECFNRTLAERLFGA